MNKRQFTNSIAAAALTCIAVFPGSTAKAQSTGLPTWTGQYEYQAQIFKYTMIGDDPRLGRTTTIPVILIPLKLKFDYGLFTFDPEQPRSGGSDLNGQSPLEYVKASPFFNPAVFDKYLNDPPTQFLDAYQRANFWNIVNPPPFTTVGQNGRDFHILLSQPIVIPMSRRVPIASGFVEFPTGGPPTGVLDWAYFQDQLPEFMRYIPNTALTIFLLDNVSFYNYANKGISWRSGGFHSNLQGKTYAVAGVRESVLGLAHELGEWLANPMGKSTAPGWIKDYRDECEHIMEIADPLSGHYFDAQVVGGRSYRLVDLAFVSWFSRSITSSSRRGWRTFQNSDVPNISCQ